MDEVRINAAIAELNALVQSLIQRNINLACDLATAKAANEKPVAGDSGTNDAPLAP